MPPLFKCPKCDVGRTLKAVILAGCLIGFIYQVVEFGTHYLTYPAVVRIDIKTLDTFMVPAVTFCNVNPVQRSKFCDKYPSRCETPENMEKFCIEFPRYCQRNIFDLKIPKVKYQSESLKYPFGLTERDIMELYQNSSELDVTAARTNNHEFIKNSSKNLQRFFLSSPGQGFHLCYTDYNLFINKREPTFRKFSEDESPPFAVYLLDVQPSESFRIAEKFGVRLAVHSPYEVTNPFIKGVPLTPGNSYKVKIRYEEEWLLPYPYKTDCKDYNDLWLKSGKTEPRSRQMCRDRCQRTFNKACYRCEKNLAVYMEGDVVCPMNENIACNATESEETQFKILETCKNHCKKDCKRLKYVYSYEEIKETVTEELNLILINVAMESRDAIILTHMPQYQDVEVFSRIGGFMGCWMGLSIWTLVSSIKAKLRPLKISERRRTPA